MQPAPSTDAVSAVNTQNRVRSTAKILEAKTLDTR
jgi:hypothetical protein